MLLDKILEITMYVSLVGFLVTSSLILITDNLISSVSLAVLCLYLLIGTAWVNQSRKNGVNSAQTTKEVALIVLGTVLIIITIAISIKIWEALQII